MMRRPLALLSLCLMLGVPAVARAASHPTGSTERIAGHVIPGLRDASRVSRRDARAASAPLTLTVVLRRDDETGFAQLLADVYDPASPDYRRFLTPREISDRFGPSEASYAAVRAYLETNGFSVAEDSENRLTLTVHGTRADAERAFAVAIDDYSRAGRTFYANDADPTLPLEVARKVEAIAGLSDLGAPRREPQSVELLFAICAALVLGALALSVWLFWEAWIIGFALGAGGALTAVLGVCILGASFAGGGLGRSVPGSYINHPYNPPVKWLLGSGASARAAAPPANGQTIGLVQFDTFVPSDVADFLSFAGLPATRMDRLSAVAVNGGVAAPGPGESEVLLDIDVTMNLAPEAAIVVFSAPRSTSWQAMFNAMLDHGVTVISNSWTSCENELAPASIRSIDTILQAAAASGVSVFNAAGDTGSTCLGGSPNTVGVPAGSPNATAVGGTSMTNAAGWVYGSESWWQDKGGFGVSKVFSRPSYQNGFVASAMRSVPDVSSFADPVNGMVICQASHGGCPNGLLYGGTSMSAPVWAAYAARLNATRSTNVGAFNPAVYPLAASGAFHAAATLGSDFAHVGLGSPNLDVLDRMLAGEALGAPDAARSQVFYSTALIDGLEAPPLLLLPADGNAAATVTVIVRDANGHTIGGKSVALSANGGSTAVVSPPGQVVTSEGNGAAVFTVTDLTPETVTFHATADGLALQETASLTFGVPRAASGGIVASPTTVATDGTSTTTITVTLQDALGRPTAGKTVTLSQGGGHSVIVAPVPAVTDAGGQIAFTATNRVNEVVTYTATDVTDGNLPVPGNAQVTWTGATTSCVGPAPEGKNGYVVTPFATGFVAENFFFGGVNWGGCPGASVPAFVGDDVLFTEFPTGRFYRVDATGGAVSSANLMSTLGKTLQFPVLGKDGKLYAAFGTSGAGGASGSVVELDPTTGAVTRTLAANQKCPAGLAIDPLSGDLFFVGDCFGAGLDDAEIHRVRNPGSATPTVETYATLSATPTGVLAFAPNGTLFVATAYTSVGRPVVRIAGTDQPSPPAQTTLTGVSSLFWLTVASSDESGEATALLTLTDQGVTLVDLTTNPSPTATLIATTMGIGPIGPDGCLYGTGSDTVYRLTRADGTCDFDPSGALPALTLSPAIVVPDPAQGSAQTFTARLLNVTTDSATRISFRVSGANPEVKRVTISPDGTASFTHVGLHVGTDTVVATATVAGATLASNEATVAWAAGKRVSFLSLDPSAASAVSGTSVTVRAELTDATTTPATPISGASVHFEVASGSCDGVTDGTGIASCDLVPTAAPGLTTLTATFAGTAELTAAEATTPFAVLSASAELDHFACYKAKPAKAPKGVAPFPIFAPTTATVLDRFAGNAPNDQHALDLKKPLTICNPTDADGQDATAPAHAAHLGGYQAKIAKTKPAQPKLVRSVHGIVNEVGLLKLQIAAVDRVLAPGAHAGGTGGVPPLGQTTVDHFKCYKVKVAKAKRGERPFPKFTPTTVTLTDGFEGPIAYDLKKPSRLCAPADVDGSDASAPSHELELVCYLAKRAKRTPAQPKFARRDVSTNDGFGAQVLNAKSFEELCVPSFPLD